MRALHLVLAIALAAGAPATASAQALTGALVPYFDGPKLLGQNVSTTLYLQVWRTLRAAPTPNPRKLNFGRGIVRYTTEVPTDLTYETAGGYARGAFMQMVLWGEVRELGGQVLVQAYLAAPPEASHDDRPEIWTLRYGDRSVSLDLPQRAFEFDPIVFDKGLIETYESPNLLQMCRPKRLPCNNMQLGFDWTANTRDGDWAEITNYRQEHGWVYLGGLNPAGNHVADFTAALLSYYRRDYGQAARLFEQSAARTGRESPIRAQAEILAAIARTRDGQDVRALFAKLAAEQPYSLYLFEAQVMARLQRALRATPNIRQTEFRRIAALVDSNRALFPEDSEWLAGIEGIVGAVKGEAARAD